MNALSYLNAPIWLLGVFGSEKSYRKNPIIGSPKLNRWGLHRKRVQVAAALAASRRRRLSSSVPEGDRRFFDENGYFLIRNVLPDDLYKALTEEVTREPFEAREMRQGQTVTRMTPLPPNVLAANPALARTVRDPHVRALIHYAASQAGQPQMFLQTVIAEPQRGKKDPQTDVHADTFHATSKAWLFLQDVGEEDGPFCFVPGSHKVTPERLEWEYQCSLTASTDGRNHHASGSFRIKPEELDALGLPQPVRMAVPANTLIVADTFAFHGRTPSDRPTTRAEVHWHMRRNPFLPWTGLDPLTLPGIRERELGLHLAYSDLRERYLKKRNVWRPVGSVELRSGPHI
ncbi:phytanoyl-CoA dioxygenase family protein [uncultured Roseibium sp.]|uniref:phytanoyl-CoA dioxygenase family protein n=1 Tax=uncultured Roseibium sp. TaxID=1936171 RepID=UPI003216332F